ncbi:MAG TPA: FAD-dependent oxidoreductase [Burkholderiales bacterium]|nr:FAD-dependent oxidoreductase [Burkholderiales bacterium]
MSASSARRSFLKAAGALALSPAARAAGERARVVVVGGGFGGATAARHLKLGNPALEVTLVEREAVFTSCPLSNLVVSGARRMEEIQRPYDRLRAHGVQLVHDEAVAIDPARRSVRLARGPQLRYDRLIVSPAVDFELDEMEGFEEASRSGAVLHAWKAGEQTLALRRRLVDMKDGGVYVLTVPLAPYRCPPAPYERASQVAAYFKRAKPRAKVLVLDANEDPASEPALFKRAWADLYKGLIEYRPSQNAVGVAPGEVRLDFDTVKGDVLNVIPPQRAADIARQAGLVTTNRRWCDVDWLTFESKAVRGIHVLGDATLAADGMPKSGHMANSMGRACAAAVLALLAGREPARDAVLRSTCYSFVSADEAVHIASAHAWDSGRRTLVPLPSAAERSTVRTREDAERAWAWAHELWNDMLG